jgi:phytoene dehydrogenase-like protein
MTSSGKTSNRVTQGHTNEETRAMLNALYLTAEKLGVKVRYDAEVTALDVEQH